MRHYFVATCLFLVTLVSCSKDDVNPAPNPPPAHLAETILNVSYGSAQLQKMDVYLPANRTTTTTKVLFLIHGGAWMIGDKSAQDFSPVVDSIRKRMPDWAIFNLNYRLFVPLINTNKFPAQEEDIKKAIDFVYSNRSYYSISDKWVIAGASAGAHLALLQAYKYNTPIKMKAVVNYFGPSDLAKLIAEETDPTLKAAMPTMFNGTETASSPITHINPQSPPTITFQGANDLTVPKSQQEAMHAKLKQNNVPEQLNIYPNEGHGFSVATMAKTYDAVISFLNTHVR